MSRPLIAAVLAIAALPFPLIAQGEGKRYALLVGVQRYSDGTGLRNLDYAEKDVNDLAEVLRKQGYRVTILTRSESIRQDSDFLRPTAKNIRHHLNSITRDRGAGDTILIAFTGHGAHLKSTDRLYFCPSETDLSDEKSLIAVDDVMKSLHKDNCKAGAKVLFVDACRNDPADGATAAAPPELKSSTRPLIPDPEGGTVAIFSCKKGQISHESSKQKRGFLFHHVIEGLGGSAADSKSGEVTWLSLAKFVSDELPRAVKAEKGPKVVQTPDIVGQSSNFVLAKYAAGTGSNASGPRFPEEFGGEVDDAPTALETKFSSEDAARVRKAFALKQKILPRMTTSGDIRLVLIPPGTVATGSRETIDSLQADFPYETKESLLQVSPSREVVIGNGFYIGLSEITVRQFRAFVKDTGYRTDQERQIATENPTGAKSKSDETTWSNPKHEFWTEDHPVTHVSYNDAQAFCEWLSKVEGRKFRLPTNDEWEYVCRGGTKTRYWSGDDPESLAKIANIPDASLKEKERKENENVYYTANGMIYYLVRTANGDSWEAYAVRGGTAVDSGSGDRPSKHTPVSDLDVDKVRFRNSTNSTMILADKSKQWTLDPGGVAEIPMVSIKKSLSIDANDGYAGLAPVARFKANPFGVYDLHGNVWEFCEDSIRVDGKERQVIRGGCYL